jgi:ADP-ribose pyrophosphatase YjhB (NUDIX family)
VWGSAFAVYSGGVDETANQISHALVRAYREKTAVRSGCVRHLLSNDAQNRNGWQKTISALGEYQNGGFWGTPVGWYLVAMRQSDEGAAAAMAHDYIEFLRKNRRPDGVSQAWEWFNPDTGKNVNPLYVATVALPYGCLRAARLLRQGA